MTTPSTPGHLATRRREYLLRRLSESEVNADPIAQFNQWYDEAVSCGAEDANAMVLATATGKGIPSARVVLLKGVDKNGFVFFTNYDSRKGKELAENPVAVAIFYWHILERQVRVEGSVSKVSRKESREYFSLRPRESQIAAWASLQSSPVGSREELEMKYRKQAEAFGDRDIPLPENWGGYRLSPECMEFWQGRESRLHDRIVYTKRPMGWSISRLSP